MLILICKVIGFFQGILKGKKSEFNYHYSKKHHGTECLRSSHVCFTPRSKMQAGCGAVVGRGGGVLLCGTWWRCPAVSRSRCQAGPGSRPSPAPGHPGREGSE